MSHQIREKRKIMGGDFVIMGWSSGSDYQYMQKYFIQALDYAQNLEEMLTDFHDSPFNRINQFAGMRPVVVSDEILEVIKLSLDYSKLSQGAFDISYASVGHLWRAARKKGELPSLIEIEKSRSLIDYRKIKIDEHNKTVYLPLKDMRIGLGGIGKGYIIDKVFNFLRKLGFENFMINGSGDVRVHSSRTAPRPWRFGIQNPFDPSKEKKIGWLCFAHGALATSGDYNHYIDHDSKKFHHILNPQTGVPTIDLSSVSVLSETALEADTHATVMMIMGKVRALVYANENKLKAILVDVEGNVLLSSEGYRIFQEKKNEVFVA